MQEWQSASKHSKKTSNNNKCYEWLCRTVGTTVQSKVHNNSWWSYCLFLKELHQCHGSAVFAKLMRPDVQTPKSFLSFDAFRTYGCFCGLNFLMAFLKNVSVYLDGNKPFISPLQDWDGETLTVLLKAVQEFYVKRRGSRSWKLQASALAILLLLFC